MIEKQKKEKELLRQQQIQQQMQEQMQREQKEVHASCVPASACIVDGQQTLLVNCDTLIITSQLRKIIKFHRKQAATRSNLRIGGS